MDIELGSGSINPKSGFLSNRKESIPPSSNPSSGDLMYSVLLHPHHHLLLLLLLLSMNVQSVQRQSVQTVLLVPLVLLVLSLSVLYTNVQLVRLARPAQLVLFVKSAFVQKFIVIPATALFVKIPPSFMQTSLA